jgi:hypothetical protein
MSRQFSYLFAGAAFALCASASAAAFAQAAAKAPAQSQTLVRTEQDGQTHEVRVIRDASGKVTVTRDGKTTVVDPHEIAMRTMHAGGHRDMAEHLRNALQLRANQEAALTAYVAALQPQAGAMMAHAGDHDGPQTTPERLAEMERMLVEHDAQVRGHIAATRAFYNQLDPAQRKAFDEMGMGAGHMGMMQQIRFIHAMPPVPPIPPIPPIPPHPGF